MTARKELILSQLATDLTTIHALLQGDVQRQRALARAAAVLATGRPFVLTEEEKAAKGLSKAKAEPEPSGASSIAETPAAIRTVVGWGDACVGHNSIIYCRYGSLDA